MHDSDDCQSSDPIQDQDVVPNKANDPQNIDSANFARRLQSSVAEIMRDGCPQEAHPPVSDSKLFCDDQRIDELLGFAYAEAACHCRQKVFQVIDRIFSLLQEIELPDSATEEGDRVFWFPPFGEDKHDLQKAFRAIITELSRIHKKGISHE